MDEPKWIWIGNTITVKGKTFVFGTCHNYVREEYQLVDCWTRCADKSVNGMIRQTQMIHYIVEIDNTEYPIPKIVAVAVKEPLEDHHLPRIELAYRKYIDKTVNMIEEWKKATGIDISAKKREDKADYKDEVKYAELLKLIRERDDASSAKEKSRIEEVTLFYKREKDDDA